MYKLAINLQVDYIEPATKLGKDTPPLIRQPEIDQISTLYPLTFRIKTIR